MAMKKFDFALTLDSDFMDALYNSAVIRYELAMQASDPAKQEELLRQVINRYELVLTRKPDDVDAMVNLGTAYRESKTTRGLQREMELLLRAYELAPEYGLVWLNMGHHNAVEGGVRSVAAVMEGQVGQATILPEKLELAKKCFRKAGEVDPRLNRHGEITKFMAVMDQIIGLRGDPSHRKGSKANLQEKSLE